MEVEAVRSYLAEHHVEDLILELTESLLKDKPMQPKKFLLGKLEEEIGDGVSRREQSISLGSAAAGGLVPAMRHSSGGMDVSSEHLKRLFESTRSITAEIVPKETINIIIRETAKLLNCDRVSLFVYNPKIKMLILTASNLAKPIRVQPGQGIAGHVFETQETVSIPDCYQDPRFDPGFDKLTGYHTKSLLVMPIVDFENETVGVLQAINKLKTTAARPAESKEKEENSTAENPEGASTTSSKEQQSGNQDATTRTSFSPIDELLLGHLTQHAGIALRNAEVYRDAIVASERANGLLHVIQALSQDLGTQSTILTITMHASELVQADRCTVFLVDEGKDQLWSVSSDREIRIPKSSGIAGECATGGPEGRGIVINIPDAYEDARFNQQIDQKTGYHTQSMLCVPIRNSTETKVIGVIQMINKIEIDQEIGIFLDEDCEVLETFAKFVGEKLQVSSLLSSTTPKNKGLAKGLGSGGMAEMPHSAEAERIPRRSSGRTNCGPIITEEEAEEGEMDEG
ncbi:unnamed protein product [Amoebophrya sp. A25]|nr:unnamed protein product [Amoebophrya sp. A25]|eukprot:GSA25T00006591001.1